MKRRITSATLLAALLVLGSFAMPAGALEVGDVDDGVTAEACALAVAGAYGAAEDTTIYDEQFATFFDGGTIKGVVKDEQGLIDAVVAFLATQGQTLLGDHGVCGIYLEVLPPHPPIKPDPKPTVVPDPETPMVVMGALPRTGADTIVIGLVGAALLGLGLVAVRRTRADVGAR